MRMRDDRAAPELDMIAQSEGPLDLGQARLEEVQQVIVADVAGGDDKQPRGRTGQEMTVAEVASLVPTTRPSWSAKAAIC